MSAPAFFACAASSIASRVEFAPVPAMIGMRFAACFDRGIDQQAVLFEIDRRRFAGGADDDDAVGAFADVPVDQLAKSIEIERAVIAHRRDDCNQTALELGHTKFLKSACSDS